MFRRGAFRFPEIKDIVEYKAIFANY